MNEESLVYFRQEALRMAMERSNLPLHKVIPVADVIFKYLAYGQLPPTMKDKVDADAE